MGLKTAVRKLMPFSLQVPVKYLLNTLSGRIEPELDILKLLIDAGDHVIDVGGNRGIYAYKLHKLGARVEVFEPNCVCADILKAWAAGKPSVNVHQIALSCAAGAAVLYIPLDASGIAHDASATLEIKPAGPVEDKMVALRTLDSYGFADVTFIKIDVEGHESSVILGAAGSIANLKPTLLVEIEQRHIHQPIGEVFGLLLDSGYSGYFLRNHKLQGINLFDVAKDQDFEGSLHAPEKYIYNFIFVHPSTVNAKFKKFIENSGMML